MSGQYFGNKTDEAIRRFIESRNQATRNRIFTEDIKPAFDKLIEYHYRRTPIARNEDIKQDALVDLFQKIDGFDVEEYSRAFPYMNMICRNFFIQASKEEQKRIHGDFPDDDYESEPLAEDVGEQLEAHEFVELFKDNLAKWRGHFPKQQEKAVIDALIMLFENADSIDANSKKAVCEYIGEMTGMNAKKVAANLKKISKKFMLLKKRYRRGDF